MSSSSEEQNKQQTKSNGSVVETVDAVDNVENDGETCDKNDDANVNRSYNFDVKNDLSIWMKFRLPVIGDIRFNPVVALSSIFLIWGFVIWCILLREDVPFNLWRTWIVEHLTWLYMGTLDLCALFMVMLYFSKYANIKLGKDSDKPEYNDISWFMMLFACGIGVGLFFYGVAEPVFHYTGRNRYTADPTIPDNALAQIAINLTLFHWGIHGWIIYCLIGLLLGLISFREDLPMTMKSCFYPLIGDRIFGWIGDLIDILSVITTLFGVCTSLGLGTRQLNSGFHAINPDIEADDITIQVITIWCITVIATISTVSGVGAGIRRISEICFILGTFLLLMAFFLDDTFFLLNLFVQSIGYYVQYIIQLGWHTDAFEQLGKSSEASYKRFVPDGFDPPDGPEDWIDSWTLFYWGWWISWSPFVGMFIAKISRGRTIREFINGTLSAPVLYSFMWLVVFGGTGLRQERLSKEAGFCCPDKENWFLNISSLNETIYSRGAIEQEVLVGSAYWTCQDGVCGSCASSILHMKEEEKATYGDLLNEYIVLRTDFGSTKLDRSLSRISCHSTEQMWFDIMRSYGDVGRFLSGFSLIGIVLYFVTSADSGSLVIDCLSANGDPEPPKLQRIFWSFTEGATATALLVAGGKQGLVALQTAGIVSGLPYTFIIFMLCKSVWTEVQVAAGDLNPNGPQFSIGLFDPLGAEPFKVLAKKQKAMLGLLWKCVQNIVLAPWTVAVVAHKLGDEKGKLWLHALATVPFFILTILFHLLELAASGCWAIGWFWYLSFVISVTGVRLNARSRFRIDGNIFEDFFASLFFYPCVAVQLDAASRDLIFDDDNKKLEIICRKDEAEAEADGNVNLAFKN